MGQADRQTDDNENVNSCVSSRCRKCGVSEAALKIFCTLAEKKVAGKLSVSGKNKIKEERVCIFFLDRLVLLVVMIRSANRCKIIAILLKRFLTIKTGQKLLVFMSDNIMIC